MYLIALPKGAKASRQFVYQTDSLSSHCAKKKKKKKALRNLGVLFLECRICKNVGEV